MSTARLALGTAQLGMKYGINNRVGMPAPAEAQAILALAFRSGIRAVDTASTYGTSQQLLREFPQKEKLAIYSKYRQSDGYGGFAAAARHALAEMGIRRLAGVWLHDFNDLDRYPELRGEFAQLKAAGLVGELGVSVYTNEQIAAASAMTDISSIQMPFNLLDNWDYRGEAIRRAKAAGKKIFIRSAYLQGLLLMEKMPAALEALQPMLDRLRADASRQGFAFHDYCLLYPLHFPEVDYVIVGCESYEQLQANVDCVSLGRCPDYSITKEIKVPDRELINPINWVKWRIS